MLFDLDADGLQVLGNDLQRGGPVGVAGDADDVEGQLLAGARLVDPIGTLGVAALLKDRLRLGGVELVAVLAGLGLVDPA